MSTNKKKTVSEMAADITQHINKDTGALDEKYIRERLKKRMRHPFTYAAHHYETSKTDRYRIADDNDDVITITHEEVYAKEIVAALNHTCVGEHEWTPIAPESAEPPLATWFWCIRCGCMKLGEEKGDPIYRPGMHQNKKIIVQEK